LLGPGGAGTTGGSGTPAVDPETQQQVTWIRDAIDQGHNDTAADLINGMVDRTTADNPNASRSDVSIQLMESLGLKPDNAGLVMSADGRVIALEPFAPMGNDGLTYREQLARQLGVDPNTLIDAGLTNGVSNADRRLDVLPAVDTAFDDRAFQACLNGNSAACDFARQTYGASAIEIGTYRDELIARLATTKDLTERQSVSNESGLSWRTQQFDWHNGRAKSSWPAFANRETSAWRVACTAK
jgi:hypothetical protein